MTRSPSDPLLRFRPEFPILETTTYFISNSLGAMPRAAARALAEYADTWATRGVRAWADSWWDNAAREGPRIVRQAGIQAIRDKSLRRTGRAIDLALERGWRCATPRDPARRGGTASVYFPNALEVSRELNARDVVVDYRPGVGIRLSPHFYTEDSEIDRAFEVIDEVIGSGSWKRWSGRESVVT